MKVENIISAVKQLENIFNLNDEISIFNEKRISLICRLIELFGNDFPKEYLEFKNDQLEEIVKGFEDGIQANLYANKNYNSKIMHSYYIALKNNIDPQPFIDQGYNPAQLYEIYMAIKNGIDRELILKHINKDYSSTKIGNIRYTLEFSMFTDEDVEKVKSLGDDAGRTYVYKKLFES